MNKKNQVTLRDVGILFHGIPYTRFTLPHESFITLVVDKDTRCILSCSICETRAEKNDRNRAPQLEARSAGCVLNGIRYHFTGIPDHITIDDSPEFGTAIFAKAVKELAAQSELASKHTEHGSIQIDRTPADLFVIPSCPPYKQPHPSPKNPLSGEAWRQRGHRFPRD